MLFRMKKVNQDQAKAQTSGTLLFIDQIRVCNSCHCPIRLDWQKHKPYCLMCHKAKKSLM